MKVTRKVNNVEVEVDTDLMNDKQKAAFFTAIVFNEVGRRFYKWYEKKTASKKKPSSSNSTRK